MTRIYAALGGAKEVYAFQSSFQGGELDPVHHGQGGHEDRRRVGHAHHRLLRARPEPGRHRAAHARLASWPKARKPLSWLAGWAYAIPSTAREKKGAWELIRFLTSQRALEIMRASENFTALSQGRVLHPAPVSQPRAERVGLQNLRGRKHRPGGEVQGRHARVQRAPGKLALPPRHAGGPETVERPDLAMEDAIFQKKTPQESLDYHTAIVQRDLDLVLTPPRARPSAAGPGSSGSTAS
jgi:hypothetical protein